MAFLSCFLKKSRENLPQIHALDRQFLDSVRRPIGGMLNFAANNEAMNRAILITGASGGIGESLARKLAAKKHHLLLVARNEWKLKQLSSELAATNGVVVDYVSVDLAANDGAAKVWNEVIKKNLIVTTLVNNAGVGSSGEFVQNNLQRELAMLHLNNIAMVELCHLFLNNVVKGQTASIINIGSMASFFPSPYMAVYAASKAFVRSFTLALAEECRPKNVHVLFFAPGLTSSNFMNTVANDNPWGKTLTEQAPTQIPDEVADELIGAWEKRKTSQISGARNRIAFVLTSLIPNSTIARIFASQKRKRLNV